MAIVGIDISPLVYCWEDSVAWASLEGESLVTLFWLPEQPYCLAGADLL